MSPRFRTLLLSVCLSLSLCAATAQEQKLRSDLNEQIVMLRVGEGISATEMETTLFKPYGPGPFPLVVINHGKSPGNPRFQPRGRFLSATGEFVKRGYLVAVPMRRGFSKSGGGFVTTGCNIASNGLVSAQDIRDVLNALIKRPDIDSQRIVVIGQSHGGLATLALGTMNVPGVRGLINFAGGYRVGIGKSYCNWEASMTDAFESYAAKTSLPSLWFYGDNDSAWGAELPKVLHSRYTRAGGKAKLVSFGVFADDDAHVMFAKESGRKIWVKPVDEFLRSINMPAAADSTSPGSAQKETRGAAARM